MGRFGGLIVAIVIAAIAAVVVLRMGGGEEAQPAANAQNNQQLKTANIYVAATPISIGATITPEMVAVQPWPEHLVLEGFVRSDAGTEGVVGTVARAPFQAQEPLLKSKLANPNDPNFLAGALPKGMRVITLVVNEIEGLAGFVFPGDRVDVILTHEIQKKVTRVSPVTGEPVEENFTEAYSETLLNNVTVMAVDQRATSQGATDKDGKLVIPRSVSLMVSPADAQRVRLGQKVGTLTLSLRSLADRDAADPATVMGPNDVSQIKSGQASDGVGGDGVIIYRGSESSNGPRARAPQAAGAPAVPSANVPTSTSNAGR